MNMKPLVLLVLFFSTFSLLAQENSLVFPRSPGGWSEFISVKKGINTESRSGLALEEFTQEPPLSGVFQDLFLDFNQGNLQDKSGNYRPKGPGTFTLAPARSAIRGCLLYTSRCV